MLPSDLPQSLWYGISWMLHSVCNILYDSRWSTTVDPINALHHIEKLSSRSRGNSVWKLSLIEINVTLSDITSAGSVRKELSRPKSISLCSTSQFDTFDKSIKWSIRMSRNSMMNILPFYNKRIRGAQAYSGPNMLTPWNSYKYRKDFLNSNTVLFIKLILLHRNAGFQSD